MVLTSSVFADLTDYAMKIEFTVSGDFSDVSDFPVLVRLAENSPVNFSYAACAEDGSDIRFFDRSGTVAYPYEIDTWNPSGESLVWVRLPSAAKGASFVMCYGRSGQTSASDGATVWSDYVGVWHMDSVDPADSTANGFDGTHKTDNLSVVSGAIGSAVNVPRSNNADGISCGQVIPNSELADGFTVEGWCRPTQYGGMGDGAAMFGKDAFISIRIAKDSQVTVTSPGKSDHKATGLVLPAVNTWWHWAVTFKMNTGNDGFNLYVNGQCVKTMGAGDINDKTGTTELFLGRNQWGQAFKGDIDEIRLSKGVKSAERIVH